MIKEKYNSIKKRLATVNRYYQITNFYAFLKSTAYQTGVFLLIFILLFFAIDLFIVDVNSIITRLFEICSPLVIILFFLLSETLLGLIPPEIFIVWSSNSTHPSSFLFLLATMSYVGGIFSYLIGSRLFLIPRIKNHIEIKITKHIANLHKWGGLFIVLGAISPIPHSIVSLTSGLIKYNFKYYLLWSLFRYLRFILYAIVIFKIL